MAGMSKKRKVATASMTNLKKGHVVSNQISATIDADNAPTGTAVLQHFQEDNMSSDHKNLLSLTLQCI